MDAGDAGDAGGGIVDPCWSIGTCTWPRHVRIDIAVPEIDEEVIDPGGHVGEDKQNNARCQPLYMGLGQNQKPKRTR